MSAYSFTVFDELTEDKGQSYPLQRGQTLLKNMLLHKISTHSKCGGKAICGHCRVKIISAQSHCNKPVAEEKIHLSEEQIQQGWRLSCQLYCLKDITIYFPTQDEITHSSSFP